MANARMIDSTRAALLVVDVQEAFRSVIQGFDGLASRIAIAVRGFQILDVPILVTEQYPKGLGNTAHEIRSVLSPDFEFIEKTAFSSCGAELLETKLQASGVTHVIVCGLETHVCVNQTSHDLLDRGFTVHLLTDCVASRSEYSKQAGLSKMLSSGVIPSSIEMALFEMMRDARHEKFKEIQQLIK